MKKVMITGFGPFLSNKENPSAEICRRLSEVETPLELVGVKLPVCYHHAARELLTHLKKHKPDAIMSLGLAADRELIEFEKIAINFRNSTSPDNSGVVAENQMIDPEAPDGLMTTLPYKKMIGELSKIGIQSKLSLSAGSYVCNEVFFELMKYAQLRNLPAGFIHLPNQSADQFLSALPVLLKCLETA